MNLLPSVLICDDDPLIHLTLKKTLEGQIKSLDFAFNSQEALAVLNRKHIDCVVLDIQMRTPTEGLEAIPKFKLLDPEIDIIINSGVQSISIIRDAMKLGATDFLSKTFEAFELQHTLQAITEKRALRNKLGQSQAEIQTTRKPHTLIGNSAWSQNLRAMIEKIKKSPANVMIFGETGTGKEVIARALRKTNSRGELEPFVAIDSSTIQNTMAESILFGHEQGAFTGADRLTKGLFENANGGVVYFDEIGNMPLEIQAKLLRVLQEKEVCRLGSSKPIALEFRVICATNQDLEKLVQEGKFKADLLQRLNVLPIHTLPLRERAEDIPELIEHFSGNLVWSNEAVHALKHYPWPGNVRELVNAIAYITTFIEGHLVEFADLPPRLRDAPTQALPSPGSEDSFYTAVEFFEKNYLKQKLQEYGGNVSKTAVQLKMDRSHLYTKLKKYGLD